MISAFYGLEGAPIGDGKVTVLPGRAGQYGNETIRGHVLRHFGDLRGGTVFTLMDVWVLDPALWGQMNVVSWTPIDHEPIPPRVANFFRGSGAVPIAMSKFGQEQLGEFDPLYVPHGIDARVYKPTEQAQARETIGWEEDAFIIGVVAANKGWPPRKCFPEILQAFAEVHRKHPHTKLYLHTEMTGKDHGMDLRPLVASLNIPDGALIPTDQYAYQYDPYPPQAMATLYSAFDVTLAPSRGEGFGIPVLESQACGTPVIVSDATAQRELCGSGWKVSGKREWTLQESWQFLPDVEDIIDALERAIRKTPAEKKQLSDAARSFALGYDAESVFNDYMLPAIKEAERRFEARKPMKLEAVA